MCRGRPAARNVSPCERNRQHAPLLSEAPPTRPIPSPAAEVELHTECWWVPGLTGGQMLYMIIERFRDGVPLPVYLSFAYEGRLVAPGLPFIGSCVTED